MSTDAKWRTIYIVAQGWIEDDSKFYFRDSAIYAYSDADGYLRLVADTGIKLDSITVMQSGKQFNGSADGVVNFTKAGTISDADYTTDTSGLIGIDTTNDRIYFKTAASEDWHYCAKDAGFSWPETACPRCGEMFKMGEEISMVVDGFASDKAVHASPVHKRCVP